MPYQGSAASSSSADYVGGRAGVTNEDREMRVMFDKEKNEQYGGSSDEGFCSSSGVSGVWESLNGSSNEGIVRFLQKIHLF